MNSKKIAKIGTILMVIATVAMACSMVFAVDNAVDIPQASSDATGAISGTVSNVLGVVTYICYAAAVIMLIYLGIKFITASPDGKAEVKKSAIIYVIGAVLVFAAGAVIQVIQNLANNTVKA